MRLILRLSCIWVALCAAPAFAQPPGGPSNLDFEQGQPGEGPPGWFAPVGVPVVSDKGPKQGKQCVALACVAQGGEGTEVGNLMQAFDAATFRGRRISFRAFVRLDPGEGGGAGQGAKAQLWMRVDRAPEMPSGPARQGFFDNMFDRPITGREWAEYRIVGDVAPDANFISIGLLFLGGRGEARALIDGATFEVVGDVGAGNAPPGPLTDRALANLTAFAHLYGYVRFFHPSDQAAAADWDAVAIAGVKAVEAADSPGHLAVALAAVFKPYAPRLRVEAHEIGGPIDPAALHPGSPEPDEITAWIHTGIGNPKLTSGQTIYHSERKRLAWRDPEAKETLPPIGTGAPTDLSGGVWCSLPIVLYVDKDGTLPHSDAKVPGAGAAWPDGWSPSGNDRSTRLADVVILWNVLQHSYPYFDVVQTDWPAALADGLHGAAVAPDERAFHTTLRRMVAALHDGHGFVGHPSENRFYMLPLAWDWIEEELVITRAGAGAAGAKAGDVVVSIDGVPGAKAVLGAGLLVSGATPGWIRYTALNELRLGESAGPVVLELRDPLGALRSVQVSRVTGAPPVADARPEKITMVRPGIMYVDMDRISDKDFESALPDLAKATGIIFDLRGYPRQLKSIILGHLIDKPITCARWNTPVITRPDRQDLRFAFSNWPVQPALPRLTRKVAFITAGSAISYAETYMGMVENYKLAEIVGQTTAGTNGNVNMVSLPGGYQVGFTGMNVLKHDKSQHHGVGIRPTVSVERTIKGVAEGRDEMLEKAIEVVSK